MQQLPKFLKTFIHFKPKKRWQRHLLSIMKKLTPEQIKANNWESVKWAVENGKLSKLKKYASITDITQGIRLFGCFKILSFYCRYF